LELDWGGVLPANLDREPKFKPWLRFAVLVAISFAIWWNPLTSTFALSLSDEQYTHILLILPISAALICVIWKDDRRLSEPLPGSSRVPAAVFLIIALFANAVIRWRVHLSPDIELSANMLTLVLWWIAAFALCFGARAARRALFPLCFLLWMVPLPEIVLNSVVGWLQQGSAASAHLLFAAAGIPVAQRGMLVHIPGLTLEVAPECSSIRSSLVLLVTTMVLAQLFLRSFWRKALVVAVAIPLSVAKNGLRIFTLGVLATHVDRSFLTGRLHRQGGGIFLLFALAAEFLLLWILHRGEAENPKPAKPATLREKIFPANA
jgi:exosortase